MEAYEDIGFSICYIYVIIYIMPKDAVRASIRKAQCITRYPETYTFFRERKLRMSESSFSLLSCVACKTESQERATAVSISDTGCVSIGTAHGAIPRLVDAGVIERERVLTSGRGRPAYALSLSAQMPTKAIEELLRNRPCHDAEGYSIIPPPRQISPS